MSAAEKYPHVVSVIEAQVHAEAFKAVQYKTIDPETAADAADRMSDWAALFGALEVGLLDLDEIKAAIAARQVLVGGVR